MSVDELIYKLKLQSSKLDSNDLPNIPIPQLLIYLNQAQNQLVQTRYGRNNNYKEGFEESQKRIDDIQVLVVNYPLQPLVTVNKEISNDNNIYSIDLTTLTYKYLHLVKLTVNGTKGSCKDVDLNTVLTSHEYLNTILKNDPFQVPSFEWREVPYNFSGNKIYLYSDGTFSIDTAEIEYLRYPNSINKSGYTDFNNVPSIDAPCELPDYLQEDLIIIAARMIASDVLNTASYQIKSSEQQKTE